MKRNFRKAGKGRSITCVHGFPLDHTIWDPILPIIGDQAEILLPDLRGFGKSLADGEAFELKDLADDLLTLLDEQGIKKTLLVGQSMGGYICLQFAKAYPDRLSGLILVASHPYADSEEKVAGRMQTIEQIKENGAAQVFETFPQKLCPLDNNIQEYVKPIVQRVSDQMAIFSTQAMANRSGSENFLRNTELPTAILLGVEDLFIGKDMQEKIQRDFPDTETIQIKNASHMLMMEDPEEVSRVLLQYNNY